MPEPRHILALEAYDGGSHGQFLDGLTAHSGHRFTRIGLPARKWKWRMRGAALYFVEQLRHTAPPGVDLIFTSDMTAVADLRALLPAPLNTRPLVCYFHENQLTYPVPDEADRDYQYGFTNITSCLAADAVWFNSHYHWQSFRDAAAALLARMPDCVPAGLVEAIAAKVRVLPLGLDPDLFAPRPAARTPLDGPRLLWNHRWEYDKNPDAFFEALFDLDRAGVPFRLLVAGQRFRTAPPIFEAARVRLAHRIEHFGYAADRAAYRDLLARADIVVSTAVHEFFGLSVLEAVAAGAWPLLPQRLSYPELIPAALHASHLYRHDGDLRQRLATLCASPVPAVSNELRRRVAALSWDRLAAEYDAAFEAVVRRP